MFFAVYIGFGCAVHVRGRRRRPIRRRRRATLARRRSIHRLRCAHVLASTLLHAKYPPVSQSFWFGRRETLLRGTGISSLSLTHRAPNALVLGLVLFPFDGCH